MNRLMASIDNKVRARARLFLALNDRGHPNRLTEPEKAKLNIWQNKEGTEKPIISQSQLGDSEKSQLLMAIEERKHAPRKSPGLAASLSAIVPGAGLSCMEARTNPLP